MPPQILTWLPLPLLVILCIAVYSHRNSLLEEWYLWRLTSENREAVWSAAHSLHEFESEKAVDIILQSYEHKLESCRDPELSGRERNERLMYLGETYSQALFYLGESAIPAMVRARKEREKETILWIEQGFIECTQ